MEVIKMLRKDIKCLDCIHCNEGKVIDDAFAVFKCDVYDIWIPAVIECKDHKAKITQAKENKND